MTGSEELILLPLPGLYTIHRLKPGSDVPECISKRTGRQGAGRPVNEASASDPAGSSSDFWSVTRTDDEVSVVCPADIGVDSEESSPDWRCIRVAGTLDLNLVGILHELTKPLKEAGISMFVISTFDTDYFLVPSHSFEKAMLALSDR